MQLQLVHPEIKMRFMKRTIFIWMLVLLASSATFAQEIAEKEATTDTVSSDSLTYNLLIEDIYFVQWYLLNFDASKDYTHEYYRLKNLAAAQAWNDLYLTGQYRDVINAWLNYLPEVAYDMELDRRLYWYFRYVSTQYGIPLQL